MPIPNILKKILSHKREELDLRKRQRSPADLQAQVGRVKAPLSLFRALSVGNPAVIAEIKKASPSAGVIRENFDPLEIARSYVRAGASAISMLTDEEFFQGSLDFIKEVRPFVPIPILCKDFIIDPYQVLEARVYGADALLLIVAALEKSQLNDLLQQTHELGMNALIETRTTEEMDIAVESGARIVGINNRSLESFKIDLATTEELAPMVPDGTLLVGESGLHTQDDIQRMINADVDAVLVGTHFMRDSDPGEALYRFKKLF
ncbi:MAG: indole-3-glycerol phosphate synthase TrpC [bacterium]|nr:indole-3-glycerol phosphate synthase TrpC [bacterium]